MALTNLVLPLLLTFVNQTPSHFERLIETIVKDEDLSYIQILTDGSADIPDHIISRIAKDTPNIIMDISRPVNFLDLDFPNETFAYSFNAKTMFLLFFGRRISNENFWPMVHRTVFLKDSWIVIILPSELKVRDEIKIQMVDLMLDNMQNNIIVLDLESFELNQKFYTADVFPNFRKRIKLFDNAPPIKTNAFDMKGAPIRFLCHDYYRASCEYPDTGIWYGFDYDLVFGFSKFINAELIMLHAQQFKKVPKYDFRSREMFFDFEVPPYKLMMQKLKSTILTSRFSMIVIVPRPAEINQRSYIVKPMTSDVWMLLISFVLYTSAMMKLSFKLTRRRSEFMNLVGEIIKPLVGQSVEFKQNGMMVTVIQVLLIVFSFMVNVWYLSILGSYLTTLLYEKPIRTVDDLFESGKPLALFADLYDDFTSKGNILEKVKDQVILAKDLEEMNDLIWDDRHAFLTVDFYFDNMEYPEMIFNNHFSHMKTEIKVSEDYFELPAHPYSRYKEAFRRFYSLISDVGLEQRWTEMIFYDYLKNSDATAKWHYHPDPESIVVLRLKYFIYIYYLWMVGVVVSIVAFFIEIGWYYKKNLFLNIWLKLKVRFLKIVGKH